MQEILNKLKSKYNETDYEYIYRAVEFAKEAHLNQSRASGEPYIMHPLKVAEILSDLSFDYSCVCASILHDVLEDCDVTSEELRRIFGDEITTLVEGVTKLARIKFKTYEEAQAENYRKLLVAMAEDVRVLFIKLADRLHNMRTLGVFREEKCRRISKETLDLYAPLAGRLGISSIKCELEDLSMRYLFPEDYTYLAEAIGRKRGERMGFVMRIVNELEVELNQQQIAGEVKGRPKHFYSIYKKMHGQGKTLDQIYDLIAVRVIVADVKDCYTVLGIIHSKWKPITGRFKDYIAMPKPNLYQSLHTTVVAEFGQTFEIQIRTVTMNRIAEYGIAAHWKYKEGRKFEKVTNINKKLEWLKEAVEGEEEVKDSDQLIDILKKNFFSDEIHVFTPKSRLFTLCAGATCVDFAYKVHSDVGNKCVGAKVNGKIVPISTKLENCDVVEILTNPSSKGPSRDWLKFAVSQQARTKIKAFFRKTLEPINIKMGKEMLESEARVEHYQLSLLLANDTFIKELLSKNTLNSVDDLYAAVGYGGLKAKSIVRKLIDAHKKQELLNKKHEKQSLDSAIDSLTADLNKKIAKKPKKRPQSGILIDGHDDFLVKIGRCCNPVPGDKIVGYAARGTGVTAHRVDCPNIVNLEPERMMNATWCAEESHMFTAELKIEAINKNGLLNEITFIISNQNLTLTKVVATTKKKSTNALIMVAVSVRSLDELQLLMTKLENIGGIVAVTRNV